MEDTLEWTNMLHPYEWKENISFIAEFFSNKEISSNSFADTKPTDLSNSVKTEEVKTKSINDGINSEAYPSGIKSEAYSSGINSEACPSGAKSEVKSGIKSEIVSLSNAFNGDAFTDDGDIWRV